MSIEAALEIAKGEYLPLQDGVIASKPIAAFCTGALAEYCDFRSQLISDPIIAHDQDLIDWFTAIDSRMTTNLCLLEDVLWGYWDYDDTEYARYVADMNAYLTSMENPEHSKTTVLSEEEFLETCARDRQTWIEPIRLQEVVDDLVRVIREVNPPETWWYYDQITVEHFLALGKTLALAVKQGITKVRLNCE